MTLGDNRISRRTLLGATALLPLTACSTSTTTESAPTTQARHDRLSELERKFDARLGVYALDTASGAIIAHRAEERFAFCSTFKGLAAAAMLQRNPLSHLDTVVRYTEADLTKNAAITPQHVATGMTIRDLCDAAVRYSDGTAGNLLLRDLGGPAELTAYLRGLGDPVTRMDRIEPAITEATPGDPRDTSSPRALGTDYQRIVLGDALPDDKRAFLRDLLERNATGAGALRVRAGVPQGWKVADKTGTGDFGTLNDIAIVWPPDRAPLVISLMSSKATADAEYDQALLAEAAAYVVSALA
ncbi:class A beta-lactamase [Nocardia brasiliensis]|uniref:Beta-lactamase n=1 Tax=Nocardia brasiliensis (strain ATCC 700358 / HUJEG-1) TaxID=1133849 RepID=K0EP12_NOCB7|nr:class A beta-lactamase [Nocardia brasiliensis]AFU01388.1 beta-lactamase [Nocardia brasiliensis ATCC 700358]OCF86728.1 class A beta-lactamase [Nocardia brasiliensis]